MITPNIDASFYPSEPQLRKVSPAARRQMGMGPEVDPFPKFFRNRLLATIREDNELREEIAKLIRWTR